jgi:SIR2-like domain
MNQQGVVHQLDRHRGRLAPRLVAAGLPAVLAMQDLVPINTATEFSRSFYGELIEHGQVDRASNAARASVMTARLPGAAIPALFMRLRSGQLLGKRGMILGDVSDAYWRTLVSKIRRGQCTPILGPGVASELLPTHEDLARALASGRYPFADTADLRRVSQFLGTMDNDDMRHRVLDHLTASLRRHLGSSNGTAKIGTLSDLQLDQWNRLSQTFETEIHQQLASLGLPLYLTTNFDNFLMRALEAKLGGNGKVRREPVIWREPRAERAVLSPPPAADNPVVLHLFGTDEPRDALDLEQILDEWVLTEDDHLEYLAQISHDHEIFLPASVNALLAKNTLLFLGYRLEDLDLKVILRGLLKYLDLDKYDRMQLAVQIETENPDASIQREVTDYFQQFFRGCFRSSKSDVKIYWGSAHQFMADLMVHMQESPNG